MDKIRTILLAVTGLLLLSIFFGIYTSTGFLQDDKIDKRDLQRWEYDEEGPIEDAEAFMLKGNNETCWYLIHGYTSTADEMRELAYLLNAEFSEKVYVTRLKGSGEVPSHMMNLTMHDWYLQVSEEYADLDDKCDKVNLVGFSFGGALATRLAQEKDTGNVYLLSPYLFARYKWYRILKLETYMDIFADLVVYAKKSKVAQINSKEGLEEHIAYWNMPLQPVKRSKGFFEAVRKDMSRINEPVLLQQSIKDEVSDIESSRYIFENIKSEKKELVIFNRSNHVIMADYDKYEVMQNIIDFERATRQDIR